jgi:hypothetical protein
MDALSTAAGLVPAGVCSKISKMVLMARRLASLPP